MSSSKGVYTVRISNELKNEINRFHRKFGFSTKGDALEALIVSGLETYGEGQEKPLRKEDIREVFEGFEGLLLRQTGRLLEELLISRQIDSRVFLESNLPKDPERRANVLNAKKKWFRSVKESAYDSVDDLVESSNNKKDTI